MANNIGWISLHRQIQSHWIWQDANKLKWWLDILLTVNNAPARVNLGNEIFECKRGESLISLQGWSVRWGVSKDTARNFIKLLEKDGMVTCVSIGKSTRITICKYDDYQQVLHVKQTQTKRIPNDKQTPTHPNNKENNNNNNNNKNNDIKNILDFELPEKMKTEFDLTFDKFVEMRNKTKKITDHAIVLIKKKLIELSIGDEKVSIEILNQSIINSWADVYPIKKENKLKNDSTRVISNPKTKFSFHSGK